MNLTENATPDDTGQTLVRLAREHLTGKTVFELLSLPGMLARVGKNKGHACSVAEYTLRAHSEHLSLAWELFGSDLPDCGGIEIKCVPLKKMKKILRLAVKEDTAVSMISVSKLNQPFEDGLAKKLNILWLPYIYNKDPDQIMFLEPLLMDLSTSTVFEADHLNMQTVFNKLGGDSSAINNMGSKSGAYGVAMKSKTKGAGNKKKLIPDDEFIRSRAFYIRRAYTDELLKDHISSQDKYLQA